MKFEKHTPNIENALALVDQITSDTLKYYAQDSRFAIINEIEHGTGTILIKRDLMGDGHSWMDSQKLSFENGVLLGVENLWGNSNTYEHNPSEGSIYMNVKNDAFSPHEVEILVDKDKGILNSYEYIGSDTHLCLSYRLEENEFVLNRVSNQGRPYPSNDVEKIVPDPQNISMEEAFTCAINPWKTFIGKGEPIVASIKKIDGFPKFDHFAVEQHGTYYLHRLGYTREDIKGCAYPLKSQPDNWLAFVEYGEGSNVVNRILDVQIDRKSVEVCTVNNIPTIKVTMFVQGVKFNLVIPEVRYSWMHPTPKNKRRAIETHPESHNVKVPINERELRKSIKQGYYYDDMVCGAVEAFCFGS